jgi:maltose O-acetyltransferase
MALLSSCAPRPGGEATSNRASPGRGQRVQEAYGTGFKQRLVRVGREELSLQPRALAAHLVSRSLPQFTLNRVRTALLRSIGVSIGPHSAIMGSLYITGPGPIGLLSIGEGTFVSGWLHVDLGAAVRVGDRVHFGQGVTLLTMDHEIGPAEERCGRLVSAPIHIGDGAWIASQVTILPGVSVGRGAIVAAGALVTADVPPDTMVGGVPARLVRNLDDDAPPSIRRQRSEPARPGD